MKKEEQEAQEAESKASETLAQLLQPLQSPQPPQPDPPHLQAPTPSLQKATATCATPGCTFKDFHVGACSFMLSLSSRQRSTSITMPTAIPGAAASLPTPLASLTTPTGRPGLQARRAWSAGTFIYGVCDGSLSKPDIGDVRVHLIYRYVDYNQTYEIITEGGEAEEALRVVVTHRDVVERKLTIISDQSAKKHLGRLRISAMQCKMAALDQQMQEGRARKRRLDF